MEASTADVVGAQVRVEKDIAADLQNLLQLFLPWTPTAGSPLLTAQPMELFQQRKSMDIPFMIGTVWNEATIFVYEAFTKPMKETEYAVVSATARTVVAARGLLGALGVCRSWASSLVSKMASKSPSTSPCPKMKLMIAASPPPRLPRRGCSSAPPATCHSS